MLIHGRSRFPFKPTGVTACRNQIGSLQLGLHTAPLHCRIIVGRSRDGTDQLDWPLFLLRAISWPSRPACKFTMRPGRPAALLRESHPPRFPKPPQDVICWLSDSHAPHVPAAERNQLAENIQGYQAVALEGVELLVAETPDGRLNLAESYIYDPALDIYARPEMATGVAVPDEVRLSIYKRCWKWSSG